MSYSKDDISMSTLRALGRVFYRHFCNPLYVAGAICICIVMVLLVSNGSVEIGGNFSFSYPWNSARENKRDFAADDEFDADNSLDRFIGDVLKSLVTPRPLVGRACGNHGYGTNCADTGDGSNMGENNFKDVLNMLEDVSDSNRRRFASGNEGITPDRMRLIDPTGVQPARSNFRFDTVNIKSDTTHMKVDTTDVILIPKQTGIHSNNVRLDPTQIGVDNDKVRVEPGQFGFDSNDLTKVILNPDPMKFKLDPVSAVARYEGMRWTERPPADCENNTRVNRAKLQCRKRFPHILGIGMEKCGTGAMTFFLRGHPNIAHSKDKEVYYWNKHRNETLDYYLKHMPYSSKYQLTMEYTPSYITSRGLPEDIKASGFPTMRFIVMLRDPIERAVSYYLHMQHFEKLMKPRLYRPPDPSGETHPFLADTFEATVFRPDGEVRDDTVIIEHAHYADHLERWFNIFDRRQFLVVDEGVFSRDPVPVLKEVERFLGLPSLFDQDTVFYYKPRKIWCKRKPVPQCLDKTKGRTHPDIDPETMDKLKRHYEPYNRRLEQLLGRKMSWT